MKLALLYYSFTGNNKLLAETLASHFQADLIQIHDTRTVTVKSIMMDLIFHRRARNEESPTLLKDYDAVIFCGPFWVGKIARPLLPFLTYLRRHPKPYIFVTVSGGALGKNEKYEKELIKRTKSAPLYTKAFYTADMIQEKEIDMKETSGYSICLEEATEMVLDVAKNIPTSFFTK